MEIKVSLTARNVAVVLVLAVIIYRLYRRYLEFLADKAFGEQHGCRPPAILINGWPLGIDRLRQIFDADRESRLMDLFLKQFRMWGNTFGHVFLGVPAFGTIDPINLEAILATKFKDFGMGIRRQVFFPLFGDGIFTQDGPAWKHSRDLLRPQFSYKQYQDLEVFREHVNNLIGNIPANGGIVDLQPLFFRLTLDTTTAFFFGESAYSLVGVGTSAGKSIFAEAFDTALSYVANRLRLGDLYWLIGGKEFYNSCATVHRFADDLLVRALDALNNGREGHGRYVFLEVVAKDSRDLVSLRQQMINVLVAGRDTTACLLSWTFYLLVRHPEVLRKLREEISSIVGGSPEMTRTDLQKMTYLNNILKETLRLYPSTPVNTRTALRTTFLPTGGGPDRRSPVLIPRGRTVAFCVYSLHRRFDLYGKDAEEFRPERWEENLGLFRDETTAKWGYLPFNGGPRICLGIDFALTQAAYVVVRILQKFPIVEMPPGQMCGKLGTERQTTTVVLYAADGCKVLLG